MTSSNPPVNSGGCGPCIGNAPCSTAGNNGPTDGSNGSESGHSWLACLASYGHSLGPDVPPGQCVPQPKFHPVPTRPVFEPQLCYPPPELISPALVAPPPDKPALPAAAHTP